MPQGAPLALFLALLALVAYLGTVWSTAAALLLGAGALLGRFAAGSPALTDGPGPTTLVITLTGGAIVAAVVGRLKMESELDRAGATSARAAANALSFVESVATDRLTGIAADDRRLYDALLAAMIRLTRAHAGAIYLCESNDEFSRVAAYGLDELDALLPPDQRDTFQTAERGLGLVALERRALAVRDLAADGRFADSPLRAAGIRSVLAVPLRAGSGESERVLGVAAVALLVPHRFSTADVARLEALASRTATLLASARAADRRADLLDRTRADLRRLQHLFAAIPEAVVVVVPPDGQITTFNTAAERLFGPLLGGGVSAETLTRFHWPDGRPAPPGALPLSAALASGEIATGVELVWRQGEGREINLVASAAPLRDADGAVAAVVGVFQDIGPLKAAERLREEFVSIVSHELRSPLTPIRGFAQLVARDLERAGGDATQVARLRSLNAQVDRLTRLVDDLLDVSSLRSGRLEIEPSATDLVALCALVVQGRQPSASAHTLGFVSSAATLVGNWDAVRLNQVLDNLVENAIKYSPDGGRVTVTLTHESGTATITVDDEGPGVPPPDRPYLFNAFYRTAEATARRTGGLGLGLYICREIVRAHGGDVAVGESPAGGARFTLHLPVMPVQTVADEEPLVISA